MSGGEKTDLQRRILLTWYENPNATNSEIADICDCSASYVSQIKNRFDGYDEMEYMFDRQDEQMERMFGDDIFAGSGQSTPAAGVSELDVESTAEGPGLAELYDDLPNNAVGYLMRLLILIVMLYVLYEVISILLL